MANDGDSLASGVSWVLDMNQSENESFLPLDVFCETEPNTGSIEDILGTPFAVVESNSVLMNKSLYASRSNSNASLVQSLKPIVPEGQRLALCKLERKERENCRQKKLSGAYSPYVTHLLAVRKIASHQRDCEIAKFSPMIDALRDDTTNDYEQWKLNKQLAKEVLSNKNPWSKERGPQTGLFIDIDKDLHFKNQKKSAMISVLSAHGTLNSKMKLVGFKEQQRVLNTNAVAEGSWASSDEMRQALSSSLLPDEIGQMDIAVQIDDDNVDDGEAAADFVASLTAARPLDRFSRLNTGMSEAMSCRSMPNSPEYARHLFTPLSSRAPANSAGVGANGSAAAGGGDGVNSHFLLAHSAAVAGEHACHGDNPLYRIMREELELRKVWQAHATTEMTGITGNSTGLAALQQPAAVSSVLQSQPAGYIDGSILSTTFTEKLKLSTCLGSSGHNIVNKHVEKPLASTRIGRKIITEQNVLLPNVMRTEEVASVGRFTSPPPEIWLTGRVAFYLFMCYFEVVVKRNPRWRMDPQRVKKEVEEAAARERANSVASLQSTTSTESLSSLMATMAKIAKTTTGGDSKLPVLSNTAQPAGVGEATAGAGAGAVSQQDLDSLQQPQWGAANSQHVLRVNKEKRRQAAARLNKQRQQLEADTLSTENAVQQAPVKHYKQMNDADYIAAMTSKARMDLLWITMETQMNSLQMTVDNFYTTFSWSALHAILNFRNEMVVALNLIEQGTGHENVSGIYHRYFTEPMMAVLHDLVSPRLFQPACTAHICPACARLSAWSRRVIAQLYTASLTTMRLGPLVPLVGATTVPSIGEVQEIAEVDPAIAKSLNNHNAALVSLMTAATGKNALSGAVTGALLSQFPVSETTSQRRVEQLLTYRAPSRMGQLSGHSYTILVSVGESVRLSMAVFYNTMIMARPYDLINLVILDNAETWRTPSSVRRDSSFFTVGSLSEGNSRPRTGAPGVTVAAAAGKALADYLQEKILAISNSPLHRVILLSSLQQQAALAMRQQEDHRHQNHHHQQQQHNHHNYLGGESDADIYGSGGGMQVFTSGTQRPTEQEMDELLPVTGSVSFKKAKSAMNPVLGAQAQAQGAHVQDSQSVFGSVSGVPASAITTSVTTSMSASSPCFSSMQLLDYISSTWMPNVMVLPMAALCRPSTEDRINSMGLDETDWLLSSGSAAAKLRADAVPTETATTSAAAVAAVEEEEDMMTDCSVLVLVNEDKNYKGDMSMKIPSLLSAARYVVCVTESEPSVFAFQLTTQVTKSCDLVFLLHIAHPSAAELSAFADIANMTPSEVPNICHFEALQRAARSRAQRLVVQYKSRGFNLHVEEPSDMLSIAKIYSAFAINQSQNQHHLHEHNRHGERKLPTTNQQHQHQQQTFPRASEQLNCHNMFVKNISSILLAHVKSFAPNFVVIGSSRKQANKLCKFGIAGSLHGPSPVMSDNLKKTSCVTECIVSNLCASATSKIGAVEYSLIIAPSALDEVALQAPQE